MLYDVRFLRNAKKLRSGGIGKRVIKVIGVVIVMIVILVILGIIVMILIISILVRANLWRMFL